LRANLKAKAALIALALIYLGLTGNNRNSLPWAAINT
jgi:hypothetical protein